MGRQIAELKKLEDVTINTEINIKGKKLKYIIEIINFTKQIEYLQE